MKHPSEVTYLAILIFIGLAIGFICRFNDISEYILFGGFILTILFAAIHLYKNCPEWILSPVKEEEERNDHIYKHEVWRLWKKNTNIRMIFMILSCIFAYLLGHIIWEYTESLDIKGEFGDLLVLSMIIILTPVLFICIAEFIKKEKELYDESIWTKSYILEQYEERMIQEEYMDGSYLE
jgi:hypothetical protein